MDHKGSIFNPCKERWIHGTHHLSMSKPARVLASFTVVTLVIISLLACGHQKPWETAPQIFVGIKSPYTAEQTNEIFVRGASALKLRLKNLGEPFDASIPAQTLVAAPSLITVSYQRRALYAAQISLFSDDGVLLAEEKISWTHDHVMPPDPIVGFAEKATNDPQIILLFATNRGPLTNKAWISGDLDSAFSPEGSLYDIPADSRLPLTLSPGDGWKNLTIALRNDFGLESGAQNIRILQKTHAPRDCDAAIASSLVTHSLVRLKLMAKDTEPSYFGVQGDTRDPMTFKNFFPGDIVDVPLTEGNGDKKVTVFIRDSAENYCLRKNFQIVVNPHAPNSSLIPAENVAFTMNQTLNLRLSVPDFPEANLEMMLAGAVDDAVKKWQPYSSQFRVELTPGPGEKTIEAYVRPIRSKNPRYKAQTRVFLKPFFFKRKTSQGIFLSLAYFSRITSVDIRGCLEFPLPIKPISLIPCTPNGQDLIVTYSFDNNTTTAIKIPNT